MIKRIYVLTYYSNDYIIRFTIIHMKKRCPMVEIMYRKMYTQLFNAVTNALERMADAEYIDAEAILKKAQCETEQTFLLWEEHRE